MNEQREPVILRFRVPAKRTLVPQYDWDGGPDAPTGKPMPFPYVPQPVDLDAMQELRLAA